jgi:hypothetical protein
LLYKQTFGGKGVFGHISANQISLVEPGQLANYLKIKDYFY